MDLSIYHGDENKANSGANLHYFTIVRRGA
jgi:hypothetical protein